jgi:hypothetical protein
MRNKNKERFVAAVVRPPPLQLLTGRRWRCWLLACLALCMRALVLADLHAFVSYAYRCCSFRLVDACLPACLQILICNCVCPQVTPANPHLLHGLLDDNQDLQIDAAAPLLAVVPQVGSLN